ncbi:MAG: hypothetical protein M4579_007251 [Chaenotheca gracillima]|nr:MAG: hypothetical protein M4579_007251 [Chaenotheca gracillima]
MSKSRSSLLLTRRMISITAAVGFFVLVALVIHQYHDALVFPVRISPEPIEYAPSNEPPVEQEVAEDWTFDPSRDARNHGLTTQQCLKAFPDFYTEIDRAVEARKGVPVMEEDLILYYGNDAVNHTQHRVLIYDGQLRVTGYQNGGTDLSRSMSILSTIHRALTALPDPSVVPNVEFVIDVEDFVFEAVPADRVAFTFHRRPQDESIWVMPDFNGWSFPDDAVGSYEEFRGNVKSIEVPFSEKVDKVGWRGSVGVNPELRKALVDATAEKSWADVKAMTWRDPVNLINMHEFCRYKFVAHTEGNTWSGRLRYLNNCHSISVIHSLNYIAHYYPMLKSSGPKQNYIDVQRDFGDLEAEIVYYIEHPEEAQRIADESARVFRDGVLTPAAESCYWRRMFSRWSEVQGFKPRLWTDGREGEEGPRRQRGVSWERESNRIFVNAYQPIFP